VHNVRSREVWLTDAVVMALVVVSTVAWYTIVVVQISCAKLKQKCQKKRVCFHCRCTEMLRQASDKLVTCYMRHELRVRSYKLSRTTVSSV
jgi:hypothetical protein